MLVVVTVFIAAWIWGAFAIWAGEEVMDRKSNPGLGVLVALGLMLVGAAAAFRALVGAM